MNKFFWLIGIALLLSMVLLAPSLVKAEAFFEVSNLVITPSPVAKGEPAKISVTVKNTGASPATHSLELKIDGKVEATKRVTLGAGASETVTFTVIKDKPGKYSIEIGGLTASLTVLDVAFHVTDLTISPKQVNPGEPIKISVKVTNIGSDSGTYTLWLKVKKEASLSPKASKTVTFTLIESSVGSYQLEVAGLDGEFSVIKAPPWWHNWWLIGGIVMFLAILALIIIWLRSY